MKTATPKSNRNDKHSHIASRCVADRISNRKEPAAKLPTWELYIGFIQLVIIGPGDKQWYPCSKANYGGPVGTPEEHMIATEAVSYLNAKHNGDEVVTKANITAILKLSAQGITTL